MLAIVVAALSSHYRLLRVASAFLRESDTEAGLPLPEAHFRGRLRKPNQWMGAWPVAIAISAGPSRLWDKSFTW